MVGTFATLPMAAIFSANAPANSTARAALSLSSRIDSFRNISL